MNDPAFWRHAAQRFLDCDPRSMLRLDWQPGSTPDCLNFGFGGGSPPTGEAFETIAAECGKRINPEALYHLDEWLKVMARDPTRYGFPAKITINDRGSMGFLDHLSDASAEECKIRESAAYEDSYADIKGPPPEMAWAVCPRYREEDNRQPQYFADKAEADAFWRGRALHLPHREFGVVDRIALGWQNPVPVKKPNKGVGTVRTFQEFYPPGDIPKVVYGVQVHTLLGELFAGTSAELGCVLADEWDFPSIELDANQRAGHRLGRSYTGIPEAIFRAAYDFDVAIRTRHANLSAESVADFFTSWQFWKHFAGFCVKASQDPGMRALVWDTTEVWDQASKCRESGYVHFATYGHELRALAPAIHQAGSMRATRRAYREHIDAWMKENGIKTVPDAARRLGVSESTLKSIRTDKGEIRYSAETLERILEETRLRGE